MATTKADKLSGGNLIIALVLISIVVIGLAGLVGKVLVSSIILDTKVVKAKTTANNHLTSDLSAAPQLVSAYSALGPEAQTLSDALPTTPDFPGLIVTLENMSNNSGVKVKSVTPVAAGSLGATTVATPAAARSTGATAPQVYAFSISVDGSYSSMTKFLAQVETSARPMRVVGLQLAGDGASLSGQFNMDTYYQVAGQLPLSEETVK